MAVWATPPLFTLLSNNRQRQGNFHFSMAFCKLFISHYPLSLLTARSSNWCWNVQGGFHSTTTRYVFQIPFFLNEIDSHLGKEETKTLPPFDHFSQSFDVKKGENDEVAIHPMIGQFIYNSCSHCKETYW